MKKSVRVFNYLKIMLAFLSIAGFIFIAILLEPSISINKFKNLDSSKLATPKPPIIYDIHNNVIAANFFIANIYTSIDTLPNHVKNAFIAAEDTRFYQHSGVDYYRISGAAYKNIKSKGYKQGASTITQQLIKNTHLSSEKKIKRKINEVRLARALERKYSKSQILEMYLNRLYFGNNVYGLGAAAEIYFKKPASKLDANESAFLAAVINNPSKYNPISNQKNTNQRRRLILTLMLKNKLISKNEFEKNIDSDIISQSIFFEQYSNLLLSEAGNLLGISKNQILSGYEKKFEKSNLNNYKIYSYLDLDLQQKINSVLNDYEFDNKNETTIHALVMTSSGEVIADCSTSNLNLTNNFRQPGSLIKPIIAYAPAFEKRLIVPHTPILDEPKYFEEDYAPKNYKDRSLGWISISQALKQSQNIPAVKLTELCGIEYSKNIAQSLGYSFDKKDETLALSLGGMTKGVTLLQAANSFQAFANDGKFIKASPIYKITDQNNNVLYENTKKENRAVSKETAYFINEILSQCTSDGTAKRIGFGAAKTGTVGNLNGNSDAYVVAYNQKYITAVWIGAKNGLMPNNISGGTHPCIIAKKILNLLPNGGEFSIPDTIKKIEIDANEYNKRQRIVKAEKNILPKDRIKISMIKDSWHGEDAIY